MISNEARPRPALTRGRNRHVFAVPAQRPPPQSQCKREEAGNEKRREQEPKRRRNTWHDRSTSARSWTAIRSGDYELDDQAVLVQNFRDYFNDHRLHTDAKMLGSDGELCHPWTRGLLQPAQIKATRSSESVKNPIRSQTVRNSTAA
jgi:hypothetical protein